jgi:hypothetical protein
VIANRAAQGSSLSPKLQMLEILRAIALAFHEVIFTIGWAMR